MSVEVVIKNGAKTTGEGPHWDDTTRSLLYVDILNGGVIRWNSVTGQQEAKHFDEPVSLVVPCRKGGYIIGMGRKLAHLDWDSGKVTVLHEVAPNGSNDRFNDGKCDSKGRLWAGTMGHETVPANPEREKGALFCLGLDGQLVRHVEKIDISNGLAWTEDNRTMYYIDSLPRKVYGFDYDINTGNISNQRTVVDFGEGTIDRLGFPDGMAIDTEGKIWVACYRVGKVVRFDPQTGEELRTIEFPALRTTSCCFGGKNLDELYVTCGRTGASEEELEKYPLSGSIFKVTGLGVKGYPASVYEG
ncbi:regucalcin-like [Pecten maximus]|uniref:regucalcin-like n=1 Tax=Pecten maximus TaxID=6579 RepID=UPI0014590C32|nr:regucalcin-like [Pecten maximus]XP_033737409.1 regucalcin-like [Pecten maximus]